MKKYISTLLVVCMLVMSVFPVYADESKYNLEVNISSDVYGPEDSILISGSVFEGGKPISNALVTIHATSKGNSNVIFINETKTDSDGKFNYVKEQIGNLEVGDYVATVNSMGITKTLEFRIEEDQAESKITGVKESYYQGDEVNITVVAYDDGEIKSNTNVEVKIKFEGQFVKVSQGITDKSGKYVTSYKINKDAGLGTYSIEATLLGQTVEKQFTVKEKIVLKSIEIQSTSTELKEGETLSLEIKGTMSNGEVAPQSEIEDVVWTSSDNNIATVDSSGVVKGISKGTATITAKVGNITDNVVLTVKEKSSSTDPGSGSGSGSGSSGGSSSSREDDTLINTTVSTSGGTVKDKKGNIELVFEKETFSKKAKVQVEVVEKPKEPKSTENIIRVADVYDFTSSIDKLNKPVTLKMKYDKSKLNGINEELLGIYILDEDDDEWKYIGGKVNKENSTVEVKINQFGKYTIMASTRTFADIANHWAKHEIEVMAARKIVDGMDGVNYVPQGTITKAQFVKILVSLLGIEEEEYTGTFTDIKDKWYTGYVESALKAGIITADENTFNPDAPITREEMAVMVANTIKYVDEGKAIVAELTFEDKDQISESALEAVAIAFSNGIINGRTETTFVPQGTATRAEAATMIYRLLKTLDRL